MNTLKTALLIAALIASQNALSDIVTDANIATVAHQGAVQTPGVDWSKAKDNCKKLGGSWKPIRKICKIDSITIEGL